MIAMSAARDKMTTSDMDTADKPILIPFNDDIRRLINPQGLPFFILSDANEKVERVWFAFEPALVKEIRAARFRSHEPAN